jgi:hypothetical protein
MRKFKAIPLIELAQLIPEWKDLVKISPADINNLAKMFEAIDNYGQQNGLEFFQIHHRRFDDSAIAIFTVKE